MRDNSYTVPMIPAGSYVRLKEHAWVAQVSKSTKNKVWLACNGLSLCLPVAAVQLLEDAAFQPEKQQGKSGKTTLQLVEKEYKRDPCWVLDLHGYHQEQALLVLDQFLDQALLAGAHQLTIIHGQGSGVLRKAVRGYLMQHALVQKVIRQHPLLAGPLLGVTLVEL